MKSLIVHVVSTLLKWDDTSFTSAEGSTSIGTQEEILLLTSLGFWIETQGHLLLQLSLHS